MTTSFFDDLFGLSAIFEKKVQNSRVSENVFFILFLTSILQKVLELWIKKVLINNIASFCKFNILAFFNNFLVNDVIPWS